MSNPYAQAHARIRRHQPRSLAWILPLLAAGLATPLARPALLAFLDGGVLSRGVEGIAFRVGALVASAMLLHGFSDLVRGPDRAVLDPHPVRARALVAAIGLRVLRRRFYLPLSGAIVLLPIGLDGHWAAWAGASAVVLGGWLAALGVGFGVYLAGIWAALSPRLALVLDLIRGDNPRMHAAFIYAPGAALVVVGLAVGLASSGVAWAIEGWTPGWAFLGLPPLVAVLGWWMTLRLSQGQYVRATALVTEIDGLYAGLESAEESHRVYLDWLAQDRLELLRALRQGWRRLRSWATGAWMLGVLGLFAGWSADPAAPARVLAVAGGAVVFIAAVPTRMAEGDPPWLDEALGVNPWRVAGARAVAAWLYAQGVVIPAITALAIRQGAAAWTPLLLVEGLAVLGSLLSAGAALRWRGKGIWAYGPLALLIWAAMVGGLG